MHEPTISKVYQPSLPIFQYVDTVLLIFGPRLERLVEFGSHRFFLTRYFRTAYLWLIIDSLWVDLTWGVITVALIIGVVLNLSIARPQTKA